MQAFSRGFSDSMNPAACKYFRRHRNSDKSPLVYHNGSRKVAQAGSATIVSAGTHHLTFLMEKETVEPQRTYKTKLDGRP
jgi:hypothetical protein